MCAWMAHGDDEPWFTGTAKHVGLFVLIIGVILLASWVMTGPGDSMWSVSGGN